MKVMFNLRCKRECLWILLLCVAATGAEVCQVSEASEGEGEGGAGGMRDKYITCPGPLDPKNYTACCYHPINDLEGSGGSGGGDTEGGEVEGMEEGGVEGSAEGGEGVKVPRCCAPPKQPTGIFYIDDQLAMIIALSVTSVCVIATAIIIVCCFWSRCPLYTACRIRYHQDDIIAYASKDEEAAGLNDMPPEETKGVNIYSPNAMKVTLKNDV